MIRRPHLLTAPALCFVAVCLSACTHSPGGHAAGSDIVTPAPIATDAPVVAAARLVCHLIADNPDAAVAQVRGADGAPSVVSNGKSYWFFGDAVRNGPGGRQDVIPAAVATSTDFDGSDCVRMSFKRSAGVAQPLFPRLGETTAWPDGILLLDDGSMVFYMVKVQRDSPFAWHVSAVGLGRVPANSVDGVRSVESIWGDNSGFAQRVTGVRSPVRDGGDVIVYISTAGGANYAARAPIDRIAEAAAYTYWDGRRWQPRPQDAQPMWPLSAPATEFPHDNGVSVTFDEASGKWLAMYNGELGTVKVRTSDHPWGPWSEPVTWLDCRALVEDAYPYCYSAEIHRELSHDPATIYITFSSQKPYDIELVELHLGVAIHEWRADGGGLRYGASSPGDGYADAGAAFYASYRPAPGLVPVYQHADGSYALDAGDPEVTAAFYAYATPEGGAIHLQPVYRWHRDGDEALDARARSGWDRGEIAFYAPCPYLTSDNSACAGD
ncbi:MAG: DUF4185 domain-containing protein [Chloroflexota bacterium]|nr:DUF4185 domain-containing protein [Chloroflexota bacterium]